MSFPHGECPDYIRDTCLCVTAAHGRRIGPGTIVLSNNSAGAQGPNWFANATLSPCRGATSASFNTGNRTCDPEKGPKGGTGTEDARVSFMSGGANNKFVSRLVALL